MLLPLISAVALAGPNTAMVGHQGDTTPLLAVAQAHGATVRGCYQLARFCVLDFPTDPPLAALQAVPGVRYAELDRQVPAPWQGLTGDAAGTDDCDDLWDLPAVGAAEAWTWGDGSLGPVVAVADGGFLQTHEELVGHITGQYDYGNMDTVAEVEWDVGVPAHGTFISAIVAGTGDNGVGRSGLAPGAGLNLLKIADSSGALYFSYAVSALADVADGDLGIRAVNYSIAGSSYTSSFADAVDALATVDVVLVASAGNCSTSHCIDADNDRYPMYPASFTDDHVISVAGSTRDGGFNSYSHYGASSVDLAAPGVDICSAGVDSTDDYYSAGGTSYSAPLVAATVALLLESHPDLTPLELARVLRASAADNPEWEGKVRSGGVLDAAAALSTAVPRLDEPSTVRVERRADLNLQLENPAAAGEAVVVLGHDLHFDVTDASPGWSIEPFWPGDTIELPDAGTITVDAGGTVLRGPVDAHSAETLSVELAGVELGTTTVTARLVMASDGADYLNAPYNVGEEDLTGFLAYEVAVQVTEKALPKDTGGGEDSGDGGSGDGGSGDGGTEDGGSGDGGSGDGGTGDGGTGDGGTTTDDTGPRTNDDDDDDAKGGCATAVGPVGLLWLLLLPLMGRRQGSGSTTS